MKRMTINLLASLLLVAVLLPACSEGPGDAPTATIGDAEPTTPDENGTPEAVDVAANPPTLAEAQAVEVAIAEQAQPGGKGVANVYALTEDTFIGFTGYKSLAGQGIGQHFGQVMAFDGSVTVPGDDPTQAKIVLEMDMTTAETDNSILTNTLQNESFFNTAEHPKARFESTKIEKTGDNYEVTGNLTLRGKAKSVKFPAEITLDGDTLSAVAEFTVDRNAWEIGKGYIEEKIIQDEVLVELDVQAKRSELADQFSQDAEGSRPKEQ